MPTYQLSYIFSHITFRPSLGFKFPLLYTWLAHFLSFASAYECLQVFFKINVWLPQITFNCINYHVVPMYHKYLQLNHLQFGQFLTKFINFYEKYENALLSRAMTFIFNFIFVGNKCVIHTFKVTFIFCNISNYWRIRFWRLSVFIICHQPGTQKFCHILTFRLENKDHYFHP